MQYLYHELTDGLDEESKASLLAEWQQLAATIGEDSGGELSAVKQMELGSKYQLKTVRVIQKFSSFVYSLLLSESSHLEQVHSLRHTPILYRTL